jgi:hypothetical protein
MAASFSPTMSGWMAVSEGSSWSGRPASPSRNWPMRAFRLVRSASPLRINSRLFASAQAMAGGWAVVKM